MTAIIQLVNDLKSQGRWREAQAVLVQHTTGQPASAALEFELGVVAFNLGAPTEAEPHLRKSIALAADKADSHYYLGLVLMKLNKMAEAVPEFRSAIAHKPNFAPALLHCGLALSAMGDLKSALPLFVQASTVNPSLIAAHYQAGIANYALKNYQDAITYFERVCQLDPQWLSAFSALGQAYMAAGNFAKSGSSFASALALDPDSASTRRQLAESLTASGRSEEAIKLYQDMILLGTKLSAKERALAYNDWGINLFRQGSHDEALEKLVYAVDVDPSLIAARINLGLARLAVNEYELAKETFEKIIAIAPNANEALLYLAASNLFLGRAQPALENLAVLHKKQISYPALDLWTGYALLAMKDWQHAMTFLLRVVKHDSQNYLAGDALGSCMALGGKHAEAIEYFTVALKTKPDFALAHLHTAHSLEALGQSAAAKQAYAQAIHYDANVLIPEKDLIESLLKSSQFSAASDRARRLLAIYPHDLDAKLSLATALKSENHLAEALDLLTPLTSAYPDNAQIISLTGQIYLAQSRFMEADEMFRLASQLSDADCLLFYSWGKTLALLGFHELALEKFEQAAKIDPYEAEVYEAWGATLKHLKRFTDATQVYKHASDLL